MGTETIKMNQKKASNKKVHVFGVHLEPMFIYMVISTLLGARLGEVFFYNWDYFQNHLLEILLPIKEKADGGYSFIGFRGLASHGAAIGVLTGIFIFQKLNPFKPLIWILDRLTIPAAIGGVFIRTGNFFIRAHPRGERLHPLYAAIGPTPSRPVCPASRGA